VTRLVIGGPARVSLVIARLSHQLR
jgi:hypothetical protein